MTDNKPLQFKFFLPDARLLDNDEIAALRAKLDHSAPSPDEKGLWIEMTCPDHSCLDHESRLTLPVTGEDPKDKTEPFLPARPLRDRPEHRCALTAAAVISSPNRGRPWSGRRP
jgi:hypothetical protein